MRRWLGVFLIGLLCLSPVAAGEAGDGGGDAEQQREIENLQEKMREQDQRIAQLEAQCDEPGCGQKPPLKYGLTVDDILGMAVGIVDDVYQSFRSIGGDGKPAGNP